MAFLSTIGDLLGGSGWTSILAEAGVTTPGKADALLKSSHVNAQTVTCSTLWTLFLQAFGTYSHLKIGASGRGNRTPSLITGTLFGRWNSSSWFCEITPGRQLPLISVIIVCTCSLVFCPGPHALLEVASSPHSGHGDPTCTSPRCSRAILTGQVCGAEDKQAIFCNISRSCS